MDKLTSKFQLALADAQSLALGRDHQFIEPLHVLGSNVSTRRWQCSDLCWPVFGVQERALATLIDQALNELPQVQGFSGRHSYVSADIKALECVG